MTRLTGLSQWQQTVSSHLREALIAQLQGSFPNDWTVIVAADRGLYATWLFQAITALGWHPFLRINR